MKKSHFLKVSCKGYFSEIEFSRKRDIRCQLRSNLIGKSRSNVKNEGPFRDTLIPRKKVLTALSLQIQVITRIHLSC